MGCLGTSQGPLNQRLCVNRKDNQVTSKRPKMITGRNNVYLSGSLVMKADTAARER